MRGEACPRPSWGGRKGTPLPKTMLRRTWTLIVKELIQIARMPVLVLLITLGPLAEMSLIAWSTAAPIDQLPTAIVDLDRSEASRRLLAKLATTETFAFTHYLDNVNDVNALVENGDVVGALIIPVGYAEKLSTSTGETAQLGFILDGSDPLAAQAELAALEGTVQQESLDILTQWLGGNELVLSLVQPRTRVRFNEELKKSIYTVPSELGLILFAIGLDAGVGRHRPGAGIGHAGAVDGGADSPRRIDHRQGDCRRSSWHISPSSSCYWWLCTVWCANARIVDVAPGLGLHLPLRRTQHRPDDLGPFPHPDSGHASGLHVGA